MGANHVLLLLTGAASTRVSNELGAGRPHMLMPIVAAATTLAIMISGGSEQSSSSRGEAANVVMVCSCHLRQALAA